MNKLDQADHKHVTHPIQMPDLVCVADLAFWSSTKTVFLGPKQIPNWEGMDQMYGPNGSAGSGYMQYSNEEQDRQSPSFTPIGAMICSIFNKLAWDFPSIRQLATYFILANISGGAKGNLRRWDSDIYSTEIRTRVTSKPLLKMERWDEWGLLI
ncbi:hypothetical protein [Hufsiella ginkgonis]|uniref:hypothetical protein n=1 Tax=Hufsiella ginkgonis TaxID=2695274 RepID=UPI001926E4EC|nr:hypothetical protein [Hufsiella ginkgonis]